MKKLNNSGDTIIEVMLAITIAGFVLAAAVVSTDDNLNVERQSENRNIAVQIVQSQVEELDAYYNSQPQGFVSNYIDQLDGSTFCMNPAGSNGLTPEPTTVSTNSTVCTFSENDVYLATPDQIAAAGNPTFAVTISFNTDDINLGLYQATITASWVQTGLGHADNVTIDYRLN